MQCAYSTRKRKAKMPKHSRKNAHPSDRESIILLGAAMAFTLDHWDEFGKEFANELEDSHDIGMEEIKKHCQHLFEDLATTMIADREVEELLRIAGQFLRGM